MSKNMGSGPLRWLHLSDLHFKAAEKWDRRATLAALIRKVKELKAEGRGPDLVFLTGDIAYSGKKAEYDQAFVFLDRLQAVAYWPAATLGSVVSMNSRQRGHFLADSGILSPQTGHVFVTR